MSMDQPRRPTRAPGGPLPRPPRPAFPVVAVVVAIVAAILGFVILRSLDDDNTSIDTNGETTEDTSDTTVDSAADTVATTTTVAIDRNAFKVLVANASGISGSAGNLTDQLAAMGYQMLPAANAKDTANRLETTVVYYIIGAEPAGQDVARTLQATNPGVTAEVMPTQLPVAETDFAGGAVLVMLGSDLSNQTLASPGGAAPGTTVAATGDTTPASPNASTATSG